MSKQHYHCPACERTLQYFLGRASKPINQIAREFLKTWGYDENGNPIKEEQERISEEMRIYWEQRTEQKRKRLRNS